MSEDTQTIVEVRGGIVDVTRGGHNVLVIDWDDEVDYDRAHFLISELLASDLDGPTQMQYISDVIEKFHDLTGTTK